MKQVDAERLIEWLHGTTFKDEDDKNIVLSIVESLPFVGYEEFEGNKMLEEIAYWRRKCEEYERTIINMAVQTMGGRG